MKIDIGIVENIINKQNNKNTWDKFSNFMFNAMNNETWDSKLEQQSILKECTDEYFKRIKK